MDQYAFMGFELHRQDKQDNKPAEIPEYLTPKEVAQLLKVKLRTVYGWVSDERIPYERNGSVILRSTEDAFSGS